MNTDQSRFEAMVQAVAATISRRATLGALGVGFTGLLSRLDLEDAGARKKRGKKKRRKEKCKNGTTKCGERCIPRTGCCGGCSEEQKCCCGNCADLATDGDNCGACQHECLSGRCERGACLCEGQQECPLGCYCLGRLDPETGAACGANGQVGSSCASDEDCAFGAICRFGGVCSVPCLL